MDDLTFSLTIVWILDFTILLTDAFPKLIILRSFLFNFPLQLTTANCALYMLSLLQQFSQIHIKLPKLWYMPTLSWLEYYCGIVLVILPFILHNTFVLFIGFLLTPSSSSSIFSINNDMMARLLTRLHFGIWSFVLISLFMIYLYSLHRLHQLYPTSTTVTLASFKKTKSSTSTSFILKTSFYRNQCYLWILTTCIGIFILLFLFYSLFMDQILFTSWSIVFYCFTWVFFPLLTQFLLEVVYILKPQLILQSMLKIKGLEDYQVNNDSIDNHQGFKSGEEVEEDEEKSIHTIHSVVSHIPSSIRVSSSIDYDTIESLYIKDHHEHTEYQHTEHQLKDYQLTDHHYNEDTTTDHINIKRKESLSSAAYSLTTTLYSPPSFPPPLHLYDIHTVSIMDKSNTSF
ncbi:unnamed protein product [Cunninghamella blakesleeana]